MLATAAACTSSDGDTDRTPTRSEISALLTRHGDALRERDEDAFVAGAGGAFRDRQQDVYDNVAAVPLSAWSYAIGPQVQDPGAQRAARAAYGASAVVVRVSFRYALRGIDPAPSEHDLYWTFARQDGEAVVVADNGAAEVGGTTWKGPWDFGPLRVASGRSSLVLAHPADAALLPALVAGVDRAVPVVSGVVGTDWRRRVAVLVPGSAAERSVDLGSASSAGADVAAVATSDGTDPTTGAVLGQRLVAVPEAFRRLSAAGVRLVLQHEITHIATARRTTSATPPWLVEGLADYVGRIGDARPIRTVASELAAQVRRDGVPDTLPDANAFVARSTSAAAYELSWLVARYVASRRGSAGLVRFYDAVGDAAAQNPGGDAVGDAARGVLGQTAAQFATGWRAYVKDEV